MVYHGRSNDLLYDLDKCGDTPRPRWMLEGFRSAIEDNHLAELDLNEGKVGQMFCKSIIVGSFPSM